MREQGSEGGSKETWELGRVRVRVRVSVGVKVRLRIRVRADRSD